MGILSIRGYESAVPTRVVVCARTDARSCFSRVHSHSGPAAPWISAAAYRCPLWNETSLSVRGPEGCTDSDRTLSLFGHRSGGDRPMRPCVRSATLDGYVDLARSLDLDPTRLLTSVGLDVADLAAPEKWIPAGDVATL